MKNILNLKGRKEIEVEQELIRNKKLREKTSRLARIDGWNRSDKRCNAKYQSGWN